MIHICSKMNRCCTIYFWILFILLVVKAHISSNSNTHSFQQENNEVRYIVDSLPVAYKEVSTKSGSKIKDESVIGNSHGNLKFDPPILDFKERHLGIPHQEKVYIVNRHNSKIIHLSSISGNTVHFHSSFFDNKLIPPHGNTSFNVVFLGREEGEVDSNLFIHTSEGSFKYQVRGSSLQSPYRLRPLSGVRLPLNASFSPVIEMYNPYATPLQLVEVYSSGGEFHLELPSGELEGPKQLWHIPAFLTKPIIRVRFHARTHKNHTAYIRFKVNSTEEVLVVPLEVEVGSSGGLYSPEDVLDFGIGGSQDTPTSFNLRLHNSWRKPITIQNVISTPVSKALKIEFLPVKIPPESDEPTNVAQLTFDWAAALETGHTSGRILVKTKQSTQKLVIPYTARVLAGGLSYDGEVTRFRTDSPHNPPRSFQLTNSFNLPVAVTNVSLAMAAQPYFRISKFQPAILRPGQTVTLFQINLSPMLLPFLTLDSNIVVNTNVSLLSVPLLCYDGKLKKVLSERNESKLELGTVGSGTKKQIVFALVNENPVPVTILSWNTSLPFTSLTLTSIQDNYQGWNTWNLNITQERSVGPGQYAVIRVSVQASTQVGDIHGHISLLTQYETIQILAHMRVEHGSLQVIPDPIIFKHCFPGKLCSEVLQVQSLFSIAMAVTGVSGASLLNFNSTAPRMIPPAATTVLGNLSFDTRMLPAEDNYLTHTPNVTGSTRWQDTLGLPAHSADYDWALKQARYEHFSNLSSRQFNLTLYLDTTEVREHMFGVQMLLTWPQLSKDLDFPLTQVGNTTSGILTISNPGTDHPIMVQLVLSATYPASQWLKNELDLSLVTEFEVDASHSEFRDFGDHIHRDTLAFLLPPLANTSVIVRFTPTAAQSFSTQLILRNNLTVMETVLVTGRGAFPLFKFGNRTPGSNDSLKFEFTEKKHGAICETIKGNPVMHNLTVSKRFTARNFGELPISVYGFSISGESCNGYGFSVIDCRPFILPPNSTKVVSMEFTPDFTLTSVERTLDVWTSYRVANYNLEGFLSPILLNKCSAVLARPPWELFLYYCAVTLMMFLFVCVVAAAFLESNRNTKSVSRASTAVQPVLDLKSIGTGVGAVNSCISEPLCKTGLKHPEGVKEKCSKLDVGGTVETMTSSKCSKRKSVVSKRLSDPTGITNSEQKSLFANDITKSITSPFPRSKPKRVTTASPELSKPLHSESKPKLPKKHINIDLQELAALPVPDICFRVGEESESSSTTTESSRDDGDKEVEVTIALQDNESEFISNQKMSRVQGVQEVNKIIIDLNTESVSSQDLEWEDEETTEKEPQKKKNHNSSRNKKITVKSGKSYENGQGSSNSKNIAGSRQGNSQKKEKRVSTQKRALEKLPSTKPQVSQPLPTPLCAWDESRASFSDVVSRSDPFRNTPDTLPTTSSLLGPIGSKKRYSSVWSWPNSQPQTSSFFMDPILSQNTNAESDSILLNMSHAEEPRRQEPLEFQQQPRSIYQDTWTPWESLGAPSADRTPLWGNDVWAPPPTTTTWAPPGFAPRPPRRPDDLEADNGLDYDLFRSMSNIWASPLSPNNFWKPPTTNNN